MSTGSSYHTDPAYIKWRLLTAGKLGVDSESVQPPTAPGIASNAASNPPPVIYPHPTRQLTFTERTALIVFSILQGSLLVILALLPIPLFVTADHVWGSYIVRLCLILVNGTTLIRDFAILLEHYLQLDTGRLLRRTARFGRRLTSLVSIPTRKFHSWLKNTFHPVTHQSNPRSFLRLSARLTVWACKPYSQSTLPFITPSLYLGLCYAAARLTFTLANSMPYDHSDKFLLRLSFYIPMGCYVVMSVLTGVFVTASMPNEFNRHHFRVYGESAF